MNRELKLATAITRMAALWDNGTTDWDTLVTRLSDPHISHTTSAQYHALPKSKRDDIKDVGGFVGGHLANGRRRKDNVLSRSLLALDLDTPDWETINQLPTTLPVEHFVYSTASHTPQHPRVRILAPLTRDVTAEEYLAISRRIAADIGIDTCDDSTFEPHRLMYWPTRLLDVDPILTHHRGQWLDPDKQLARYDDWRDTTTWPTSSRQTEAIGARAAKQADPLEKPGLLGAFCRTWPIAAAIEHFLGDVYVPGTGGRWTFKAGETTNGVVTYDDRFAFSHHGTDPAGGQLLNAFDLVRIHKFGTWDDEAKPDTPTNKLPSYKAMTDLARDDKQVGRRLNEELVGASDEFTEVDTDQDEAGQGPDIDWMDGFERTKSGGLADTLGNLTLILTHDPGLQELRWNELSETIDVRDPDRLPWKQAKPGWADADIAQLKLYIERKYSLYSTAKTAEALSIAAAERAWHPIRDYLHNLPDWDGQERLDTLLVDYLGAADTDYTRAVTRKTLVAAVARVTRPGTKFDTVMILNGPQGTGKSTLFAKLGGDWFSDALSLTDMRDKTGAEKLQGYWILELGELAGMRKMEVETVKGFLSRTDDKFRAAYARTVESHPRQCIIVGSTNAENGFLRDTTGNRRFWPVTITGDSEKKSWHLTEGDVAQIWAEAVHRHKAKEPLHLSGHAAEEARQVQDAAIETDDRVGLVENYLDTPLPAVWDQMNLHQRRGFLGTGDTGEFGDPEHTGDLVRRQTVSNVEIWAECYSLDPALMQPKDAYAIAAIMQKLDGWEKQAGSTGRRHIPVYGRQRIYSRLPDEQPPF